MYHPITYGVYGAKYLIFKSMHVFLNLNLLNTISSRYNLDGTLVTSFISLKAVEVVWYLQNRNIP